MATVLRKRTHLDGVLQTVPTPKGKWVRHMVCPDAAIQTVVNGPVQPTKPKLFQYWVPKLEAKPETSMAVPCYHSYGVLLTGSAQADCQFDVRAMVSGPCDLGTSIQGFLTTTPVWDPSKPWNTWVPDAVLTPMGGDLRSTTVLTGSYLVREPIGMLGLVVCLSARYQPKVMLLNEVYTRLGQSQLTRGG